MIKTSALFNIRIGYKCTKNVLWKYHNMDKNLSNSLVFHKKWWKCLGFSPNMGDLVYFLVGQDSFSEYYSLIGQKTWIISAIFIYCNVND